MNNLSFPDDFPTHGEPSGKIEITISQDGESHTIEGRLITWRIENEIRELPGGS